MTGEGGEARNHEAEREAVEVIARQDAVHALQDAVHALLSVLNDIGGGHPWNYNVLTEAAEDAFDAALRAYARSSGSAAQDHEWSEDESDAMERALLAHLDEDDAMTAIQVLRPWLMPRSPQGEDHETGIEAEAQRIGYLFCIEKDHCNAWPCQPCVDDARFVLSHVSAPERDTVRLAEIADWFERDRREPDKVLCHVQSLRRLAAFPVSGESENER